MSRTESPIAEGNGALADPVHERLDVNAGEALDVDRLLAMLYADPPQIQAPLSETVTTDTAAIVTAASIIPNYISNMSQPSSN